MFSNKIIVGENPEKYSPLKSGVMFNSVISKVASMYTESVSLYDAENVSLYDQTCNLRS